MIRGLVCVLGCCAAVMLAPISGALALPPPDEDPIEGPCALDTYHFRLEVSIVQVGLPIAGSRVTLDATSAKLHGHRSPTRTRLCDDVYFAVPNPGWTVAAAPLGQTATITDAERLRPNVSLGGPGIYQIRFYVCPCTLELDGKVASVDRDSRDITINAVSQLAIPPETQPLLPPLPEATPPPPVFDNEYRQTACHGGGGVLYPQWVTAERFHGPENYRLVEGNVTGGHVAAADDFLNHDSQDQNWLVQPDRPYRDLRQPSYPSPSQPMEMEWELNAIPPEVRPTAGDRVSTVGYWIFDCGHDPFRTEIHPPVGIAVERPRAVQIRSSFSPPGFPNGLGTNIVVPGIVTDLWFNRHSGETTNNCSDTGLHQPILSDGLRNPCIREPHPLGKYTFNVYLPRDPQLRAIEAGLNPPPVPLSIEIGPTPGQPSTGPVPTIEIRRGGGATWLEVTVDLSSYPGLTTYARRVSAAWAYPQADNWGASRWNVRLNTMDVRPAGSGGDDWPWHTQGGTRRAWQAFFNTNNSNREWTHLFSRGVGADPGVPTTEPLNLETGTNGLGSDPVLFPRQKIFVHTGGFIDSVFGGDIGTVFDLDLQMTHHYTSPSTIGKDGDYVLDYDVQPGTPIPGAILTPEANALINAYVARQAQCDPSPCAVVAPERRDPNLTQTWSPKIFALTKPMPRGDFPLFESEREEFTIQGVAEAKFRELAAAVRANNPGRLDAFLADVREELNLVPPGQRNRYDALVAMLETALSAKDAATALPSSFREDCRGKTATQLGTPRRDEIIGTPGADVIAGLGGNDVIVGQGGDDVICGGDGNDFINAADGNDTLYGDGGNDTLYGGNGNDRLTGQNGNDNHDCGAGADRAHIGPGNDSQLNCEIVAKVP